MRLVLVDPPDLFVQEAGHRRRDIGTLLLGGAFGHGTVRLDPPAATGIGADDLDGEVAFDHDLEHGIIVVRDWPGLLTTGFRVFIAPGWSNDILGHVYFAIIGHGATSNLALKARTTTQQQVAN